MFCVPLAGQAKVFVKVFTEMDRMPQLLAYYYKCHKVRLVCTRSHAPVFYISAFREIFILLLTTVVIHCVFQVQLLSVWEGVCQSDAPLKQQLSEFYDTLLSTWYTQLQWSSQVGMRTRCFHTRLMLEQRSESQTCRVLVQVFKNPYEIVTVLMIQTLGAMVPSIPECIAAALDRCPAESRLDMLLELHQMAASFSRSLENAMQPHLGVWVFFFLNKTLTTKCFKGLNICTEQCKIFI